jgi:predicted O-methyltransferase YrrM
VRFVSAGPGGAPGGPSDLEAWVLAVLAKRARSTFEFGTCTGRTTWLLARNAPEEARVTTLTLGPDQLGSYQHADGDCAAARQSALAESRHATFYYSGTPEEAKVTQLFSDSKTFNDSAHRAQYDLIFVDGSHGYSYVVNDSAKALRMLRPGGVILWHDYRGPDHPETKDVRRALNELTARLSLVQLEGTSLVAFRSAP